MTYDDYFKAAEVIRGEPHHDDRFSWSDLRKLVDYFTENFEPRPLCWHCDCQITRVPDGWVCKQCGQSGANANPVETIIEGIKLDQPYTPEK